MSKTDEVRKAMVDAMKAKDKDTKDTLSLLLAALKNKAIDKRADLTEEEEVQVILKEIKQTKESLEMTPSDRTDMIEECKRRLAVLETFAPKMMDADEIKAVVESVLSELGITAPTAKDKGRIMKELMPKVNVKGDTRLFLCIMVFFVLTFKVADRYEQRHKFRQRNRQPNTRHPHHQWQYKDTHHDENKRPAKRDDRRSFPITKCSKHRRCKNIDSRKYIIKRKQEKSICCNFICP